MNEKPPDGDPPSAKDARTMTIAEYAKARREAARAGNKRPVYVPSGDAMQMTPEDWRKARREITRNS